MDFNQYIVDSASTSKAFDDGLALSDEYTYLLHAAMGVSGEAGEMLLASLADDHINMGEEIGDAAFYLAMATRTLDMGEQDISAIEASAHHAFRDVASEAPVTRFNTLNSFIVWSAEFLDAIKKVVIYEKDIDRDILRADVMGGWYRLALLAAAYDFDLEDEILPANREKLAGKTGRYKDGYTDEAALHRDLDAEQALLSDSLS